MLVWGTLQTDYFKECCWAKSIVWFLFACHDISNLAVQLSTDWSGLKINNFIPLIDINGRPLCFGRFSARWWILGCCYAYRGVTNLRKIRIRTFNPYSERMQWLCCAAGCKVLTCLGSLVLLNGIVLISIRLFCDETKEKKSLLNTAMNIKKSWIILHGFNSDQISSLPFGAFVPACYSKL